MLGKVQQSFFLHFKGALINDVKHSYGEILICSFLFSLIKHPITPLTAQYHSWMFLIRFKIDFLNIELIIQCWASSDSSRRDSGGLDYFFSMSELFVLGLALRVVPDVLARDEVLWRLLLIVVPTNLQNKRGPPV